MTEKEYQERMRDLIDSSDSLHIKEGTYKLFNNLLKSALSVELEIAKAALQISYLESRIKELETTVEKLVNG